MRQRNDSTKNSIIEVYKEATQSGEAPPVHVVGSDEYRKHQAGYPRSQKMRMKIEQTGIPGLRHDLYMMCAEGEMNDTLSIALHGLPNLMNSINLYCNRTHIDRKIELEAAIIHFKHEIKRIVGELFPKLKNEVKTHLLDPMAEDESDWIEVARNLCDRWAVRCVPYFHEIQRTVERC
jgi:hypothetical protein